MVDARIKARPFRVFGRRHRFHAAAGALSSDEITAMKAVSAVLPFRARGRSATPTASAGPSSWASTGRENRLQVVAS
jgi:hypothetical protein